MSYSLQHENQGNVRIVGFSSPMIHVKLCLKHLSSLFTEIKVLFIPCRFVFSYVAYCNGFDQRVARQQLCKHGPTRNSRWGCVFYVVRATPSAGNGPINSQSDTWHVFSLSAPWNNRGAVFFMCVVRAERIWRNTGMGIDWTWVAKFQGNGSVARRRLSL
jgi:hypothetical protein